MQQIGTQHTKFGPTVLSRRHLRSAIVALALFSVALFTGSAWGQISTGSVLGTVKDPSGAVIPGATVVITNVNTQTTRTARTDQQGDYLFDLLQSGQYTVTVTAPGFKKSVVRAFVLNAGARTREDVSMAVGANTSTVQVTGATPGLETDTSSQSMVVSSEQVQTLPLNGRNFVQLAQLAAGANQALPNAITNGTRPDDRRQTASISVDAQDDTQNNELVDGMDNNEHVIGSIGVRPSIDAIAEFRVLTHLYPASVGGTPGAVVDLITKSGTNAFHGSAYEFVRNDAFDARNFFATHGRKPEYRQNQFGASLGGPIRRGKTFFFGDYEGYRIIQGVTTLSSVPTLFEEQHPGNLSDIGGPIIPTTDLSPIALKYFALYPAPNLPGLANNFALSPNNSQFSTTFDARIDQHFSPRDSFFARYTYNNVTTGIASALPAVDGVEGGGSVSFPGTSKQTAGQVILDYTHIFSPKLLMELEAGYTRINNQSLPLNYGQNDGTKFGIVGANYNQLTSALPDVTITGYSELGDSTATPLIYLNNVFQYGGSVVQTIGTHTLHYGASLIRRQVEEIQNQQSVGAFVFNTTPSPFALANFLTGDVFTINRILSFDNPNYRMWNPSAYIQDDWRTTQWLTLNLGLRYDIFTPDTEAHGFISNTNPATLSVIIPGVDGGSASAGVKTDYTSFAPRLGFAASARPGTVIRGGFGLVFYRIDTNPNLFLRNQPSTLNYSPTQHSTTFSTPIPIPPKPVVPPLPALSGQQFGVALNYPNSYVEQFDLDLQQQLSRGTVLSAAYVATLNRHVRISPNIDLAPPAPNPPGCVKACYVGREPFHAQLPNVTAIWIATDAGYQSYNGMQVSLKHRTTHGLTGELNYTWAHAIGDIQGYSSGGHWTSVIPAETAKLERGNSDLDMRNRITLLLSYEVPYGKTLTGWKGTLGKGWWFNAIDVWETGFPFSVTNPSPMSNTGIGSDRPNQIASAVLPNPNINEWFNTAAFQSQTFGTVGSARRNSVYGPHFRHFDPSVFKVFKLNERFSLQARAEAFNLTNTPSFAQPGATLGTAGFGKISSTNAISTPRELQFALRLEF